MFTATQTYSLPSDKKYICADKENPRYTDHIVIGSEKLSVWLDSLPRPLLTYIKCSSSQYIDKYELEAVGCRNTKNSEMLVYNNVTDSLIYPKDSISNKNKVMLCKKINGSLINQ
jgi:hypothetical protein